MTNVEARNYLFTSEIRMVEKVSIMALLVTAGIFVTSPSLMPDPHEHPFLFKILQNGGNLPYGYMISLGIHDSLSKIVPERLSGKIKIGIAIASSTALIGSIELGVVPFLGTADPDDILAGFVGSLIYAGLNYWQRRRISEGNIAAVIPPQG